MSEPNFHELFGRTFETSASAPGRVNLIGEHTDYNGGYVLPTAIPQRTSIELARRPDRSVRVWTANLPSAPTVETYAIGSETRRGTWLDYIQGITQALGHDGLATEGFDARITSDVPVGSGLSSSAALEVALLRALRAAFDLPLDDVRIALLAQRAENDFVGAPVGIMDPMASSLADTNDALFLDAGTLVWELVPIPANLELIVIDSGVSHRNADGAYATRRAECQRACVLLGIPSLRALGPSDLDRLSALPDPLARRVRHVVTENARVLAAVEALRAGDLPALGRLFYASQASMRDDYEVSIPPIDTLVAAARAEPAVVGARMTGGGFGGSVVILAPQGEAREIASRIARAYAERTGRTPRVLLP